jgi:hypothetical protein
MGKQTMDNEGDLQVEMNRRKNNVNGLLKTI